MGCMSSDTNPHAKAIQGFEKIEDSKEALKFALAKEGEADLVTQVEIFLSCTELKNVDVTSLTDSACVLYMKDK